ncbi:MAG: hypothetical protein M1822_008829 [Bathelium mastoideum]|nr:MAG: hypothetical protein M1822_008829 [Bathelium mastoideum]
MPESLTREVELQTDPSTTFHYDTQTPKERQWAEFYKAVDTMKIGLLGTYRPGIGPVARSMVVMRRTGPDFVFVSNIHSQKFRDLEASKECSITFQDSNSQNWISISGIATIADNTDPRVRDLYSPGMKAWFGDLGDGVHTGTVEDPRRALIEVKSKYITYWKTTVGSLGFMEEIAQAAMTGKVAATGVCREFPEDEIEQERAKTR